MVETKAKRPRGRPRKAKPVEASPVSFARDALEQRIEELARLERAEEPAGNGRDEAALDPDQLRESLSLVDHERMEEDIQAGRTPWPKELDPPKPAPGPGLSKLFVAAVENGYIIRPAYADSYKGAGDDRSWVVGNRQALAAMVSWLVAERGTAGPDMLGGPIHMPQPEQHYAPPIGVGAADAA